ncbi:MAG: PIG-L family deacetylase [Planctomycetota bacterium]
MRSHLPTPILLLSLALTLSACITPGKNLFEEHRVYRPSAASAETGPRILAVVAHPDDEILFAGTLYTTSMLLDGVCDVALITNGEGGYKYSTLAEPIYGEKLTDEAIGRARLPDIRREEFLSGCSILGVRRAFLLNQQDHRYTQDPLEVLGEGQQIWNLEFICASLEKILRRGDYDFVFTLTPTAGTHGHHKAATVLALRAVAALPEDERPVILCARTGSAEEEADAPYEQLEDFPITALREGAESFRFDRTKPFGYSDRLNLKVIANWAIAEHKSQGTMQLAANRGDYEQYSVFELNPEDAEEKAGALFRELEGVRP